MFEFLILHVDRRGRLRSFGKAMLPFVPERVSYLITQRVERVRLKSLYKNKLVPEKVLQKSFRDAILLLTKLCESNDIGDYLEFGVCRGTSMLCMYRALSDTGLENVRLFGFDSFEGLPKSAESDDGGVWKAGMFKSDYLLTGEVLSKHGVDWKRVKLVKGWFSDTLTDWFIEGNQIAKASVIMVDCDNYSSAKEALQFCVPLIRDRTIIFLDDWDAAGGKLAANQCGECGAFIEFLETNPCFSAEEQVGLAYRTADKTYESYSRVFLVTRKDSSLDD